MTPDTTENREYSVPAEGTTDWHLAVNENWQMIDADVQEVFDTVEAVYAELENDGGA